MGPAWVHARGMEGGGRLGFYPLPGTQPFCPKADGPPTCVVVAMCMEAAWSRGSRCHSLLGPCWALPLCILFSCTCEEGSESSLNGQAAWLCVLCHWGVDEGLSRGFAANLRRLSWKGRCVGVGSGSLKDVLL